VLKLKKSNSGAKSLRDKYVVTEHNIGAYVMKISWKMYILGIECFVHVKNLSEKETLAKIVPFIGTDSKNEKSLE